MNLTFSYKSIVYFYDFQKILIYFYCSFSRLLTFHIYYFHSSWNKFYTNEVLKLFSIAQISVSIRIKFCNILSLKGKPKPFQWLYPGVPVNQEERDILCVCVCLYMCMCACVCVYEYVCVRVYVFVCIFMCMFMGHTYFCICFCAFMCIWRPDASLKCLYLFPRHPVLIIGLILI